MERQRNLLDVLMDLQNQQLKEATPNKKQKTRKMEKEPPGLDLEDLKGQVQQQVLEEGLGQERVRVLSRQHGGGS